MTSFFIKHYQLLKIFRYYRSLPESKKTILTSLMQILMITAALSLCHITLSHIGIAVLPNLTQQWLISNPSLICSLCSVNEYLILGMGLGSQSSFNNNQPSLASAKFDLKQGWQHPEKRSSKTVWQTNINSGKNWIYKYEYIGFYFLQNHT